MSNQSGNALARIRARLLAERNAAVRVITQSIPAPIPAPIQDKENTNGTRNTEQSIEAHNNPTTSGIDFTRRLSGNGHTAIGLPNTNNTIDSGYSADNLHGISVLPNDTTAPSIRTDNSTEILVAGSKTLNKDEVSYEDLNQAQRAAVSLAIDGHSFCLIGPAGSGKTTTVKTMVRELLNAGQIRTLNHEYESDTTAKLFNRRNMSAIAIVSFTNQAVRNIKTSMPQDYQANCSTIHNLLEFTPVEWLDENDLDEYGTPKQKMIFAPTYGSMWNQAKGELLPDLDTIVIEEAGSCALELYNLVVSALPRPDHTQIIFLGDLNQLPPVFDDAVLGFKQLELPVIELTEVYRNVGIITQLAHRVLEGKPITDKEAIALSRTDPATGDTIKFQKFTKKYAETEACLQMGVYLRNMITSGKWDVETSVVLIPFNVKFGTIELNKWMQQGITDLYDLEVHEVIARWVKSYHCVGDRVLHDRNYYRITKIDPNLKYTGERPTPASKHLTRFGTAKRGMQAEVFGSHHDADTSHISTDALLANIDMEVGEETNSASHIITLESIEFGDTVELKTGAINNLLPTYAMTVHKSQGSEWENVMLILHHSHSIMANRELLYTGLTRARKNLTIMYSGNYTGNIRTVASSMLHKCLVVQKIAGRTAKEKLNYFKQRARTYISRHSETKLKHGKVDSALVQFTKLKEEGKI